MYNVIQICSATRYEKKKTNPLPPMECCTDSRGDGHATNVGQKLKNVCQYAI